MVYTTGDARVVSDYDVVVVGCGMAGLSAGIRAAEQDASVAILEKSPKEHRGGHTRFTESFRVPAADTDLEQYGYEFAVPEYTKRDFYDDIMKQSNGRADPDIARILVEKAPQTIEWLTELGVEWNMEPLNPGYTVARTWFEKDEFMNTLVGAGEDAGADVFYETEARDLLRAANGRVSGLRTISGDELLAFECDAVVLAAGDYGSSDEKRTQYYGSDYDAMKIRGSRYNTGEAIDMVLDAGAKAVGQWGGAHMALIDAGSPDYEGGANRVDGYQYGLLVNHKGERFVDEGQDARAHTYAKFGRIIFEQPNHEAFIIVDGKTRDEDLMRATGPSNPVIDESLEAVFEQLGCENSDAAVETVEAFNEACDFDADAWDTDQLDGNRTVGLEMSKSNWARPLDTPPYYGYAVTGGITFAFGGVKITTRAEVVDTREKVMPGLYAAGNSTGGLFFDNYPGGTGLTNAAVYGRIAADEATAFIDAN